VSIALLVEYALGLGVNLYVTVPARDQGGGVFAAVGRALANGPAGLAVHAGLGLLLLLGSIVLVVRAVADRAGLPLASTTYYFDSLEELVTAAAEHLARVELDRGRAQLEELATRQRGCTPFLRSHSSSVAQDWACKASKSILPMPEIG